MKKKLIILLLVFVLTGCTSAQYDVTISNDNIKETITIPYEKTDENRQKIKDILEVKQSSYYAKELGKNYYYDAKVTEQNNRLLLTYTYSYPKNKYLLSEAINSCFYKKDFIDTAETTIFTTGEISCLQDEYGQFVDEIIVNIKANYRVVKHNADKVKGNVYTWHFNNDNYEEQHIYLEMNKVKQKNKFFIKINANNVIIALSILAGIIAVVVFYIYIKHHRNNKI